MIDCSAASIVFSAAVAPAAVPRFSEDTPAPTVVVAELKPPVKLAAVKPVPVPFARVIPAELEEVRLRVEVETSVAPVAETVIPVLAAAAAALVLAVTVTLRPSAAANATAPVVVSKVAVTPVCVLIALTAAATCAPRCAPDVEADKAPRFTPLIVMSPDAIAVAEVDAVPATAVDPAVAVTPVLPLIALIAAALEIPLPVEFEKETPSAADAPTWKPLMDKSPDANAVVVTAPAPATVVA